MPIKIAVLTRERQGEAFRMALGLLLLDDVPDVYIMDRKLEDNEQNRHYMETCKDMDVKIFTNCRDNKDIEYLTTEEVAGRLLDYENIIPY
ncbi:MAG: hypothetical protein IEMM0002_0535 [bacterium]|nr:MAG: hypothetical protein IEMM0002_0535 [bacterium]